MGDAGGRDPGRAYLYTRQSATQRATHRRQMPGPHPSQALGEGRDRRAQEETTEASTSASSGEAQSDWSSATGNIENAKVALDQLRSLIEDAVFLDEDSFSGMKTVAVYHQKLQV